MCIYTLMLFDDKNLQESLSAMVFATIHDVLSFHQTDWWDYSGTGSKQKTISCSFNVCWDAHCDCCMCSEDQLWRQDCSRSKLNLHSGIHIHNTVHKNYAVEYCKFSFMYFLTWTPQHATIIHHCFPQAEYSVVVICCEACFLLVELIIVSCGSSTEGRVCP